MYKRFFGLNRNPFEISPDPTFLVPTSRHNEALANLYYGVRRQKGFVVVTGEVGTGKTLLVKCLLDVLNRNQVACGLVFNPLLSVPEFLQYVLRDLGVQAAAQTKSEILLALNNFLIARYRKGFETVLIVDEAQHLSRELLEEIRLLTNLETGQQKLLQIILVGQPELEDHLDAPDLRQLKQRIALRCRLEPLNLVEVRTYISRRMELAGASPHSKSIFPEETLVRVHQISRGIPRLINTLCENSLIIAYARQSQTVEPSFIEEVAKDFRLNESEPLKSPVIAKVDVGQERKRLLRALAQLLITLQEEDRESKPGMPENQGVQ